MLDIGIYLILFSIILVYFLFKSPKPPSKPPKLFEIYASGKEDSGTVTVREAQSVLSAFPLEEPSEKEELLADSLEEEPLVLETPKEEEASPELEPESQPALSQKKEFPPDVAALGDRDVLRERLKQQAREREELEEELDVLSESEEDLRSFVEKNGNSHVKEILEIFETFEKHFTPVGRKAFFGALKFLALAQDESSVVGQRGRLYKKLDNRFKLLGKVSLSQHTKNVVHFMAVEAQKQIAMLPRIAEAYLLTGLIHDLGKSSRLLESLSSGEYRMADHAIVVEVLLNALYHEEDERTAKIKTKIRRAILFHHQSSSVIEDDLALKLKTADQEAREKELKELTSEMPSLDEVVEKDKILSVIRSALNDVSIETSDGKVAVFSVKNYILVDSAFLSSKVRGLIEEEGLVSKELFSTVDEFESALKRLLVKYELTTESLLNHFVAIKKKNKARRSLIKLYFKNHIPLILEACGILASEAEEKKTPSLKTFVDIELRPKK